MKLSGMTGVTQKTMTFGTDTHVCLIFEFADIHPRNQASKSIQKLCAKGYHAQNEHTSKI